MGLDIYALPNRDEKLSEEDIQAFKNADITLCGGILSGNGDDGSFRGKVYSDLVGEITGRSLYYEWTPPEIVDRMYQRLKSVSSSDYPRQEDDIRNLRRFFKVCVDKNLGLCGWW